MPSKMDQIRTIISKIVVSMVILSSISTINCDAERPTVKPGQGKFFWHPTDDGGYVPAFLDGGPHPKAVEGDIRFYLYTQANKDTSQELFVGKMDALEASHYVKSAPLKIICHGFSSSSQKGPGPILRTAYLHHNRDYNIILIDWSKLCSAPWYDTAAAATTLVGEKTGRLVNFLVENDYARYEDIHFLGHSLGAHVGGYMGAFIGAGVIGRITALDPALPLFDGTNDAIRIDPTDAAFVDVIHTAAGTLLEGGLAFREPRGHADFYPNSGTNQPGCGIDPFGACSHGRCYEYMAESIGKPQLFRSCRCTSWESYNSGKCSCTEISFMGEHVSPHTRGKYYLRTNTASPWSIPWNDIAEVDKNSSTLILPVSDPQ